MKVTISSGAKNICNPAYGISISQDGDFKFQSGSWHNVTQLIKVNSKGKAVHNGYLAIYFNNKVMIRAENLVLLKNGYDPSKSQTNADQVNFQAGLGELEKLKRLEHFDVHGTDDEDINQEVVQWMGTAWLWLGIL
ncbi:hypothetical protein BG006_003781 [Podila minutissima]|uniref:Polysaccharide lyase 14 domain-containing protein n=1 Tax=Podila minutissima TaxID=64525 RepID=A0A9P5VG59_9FUNG|nr:hypothetical protein BG006_003781 [Podila minutissima]